MNKKIKKMIIVIIIAVLVIFLVILPAVSVLAYESVFGQRYESVIKLDVSDFEGLKRSRYEFVSKEGKKLTGYRYYTEPDKAKGVVIMAHGIGGGGHNSYMDSADYFAHNGYDVFAYDVTGNDESEGDSVRGLPQGVEDLDQAITFVENNEDLRGKPIVLFGHSWGGYSVTSVLNQHPEVKAVCSVSGFNRSVDMIESQGRAMMGSFVELLVPYIKVYEYIKFGDISTQTSMEGFKKSDARVMVIHSEDDTTVPIEYGYDIYFEEYGNDPDFEFIRFKDKGHSSILSNTEYKAYMSEINDLRKKTFGEKELTDEEKRKFYSENTDRARLSAGADIDLHEKIVKFFDASIS